MQERCLITGSNGFIGKALSSELFKQNFEVIPLSRDWSTIPKADYIYHLGSYGNMHHQQDRAEIVRVNIQRTFDLLEATKDMQYKKFVYISSSSVNLPIQTLYSASKKATEVICNTYDKPIAIVRPYSVTGRNEQKEHLIPTLIDAAYTGKIIPFVPFSYHDYIDIDDVIREIINVRPGETVELGSGTSCSNDTVLRLVQQITGKTIFYHKEDSLRSYDTHDWRAPYCLAIKSLEQSIREQVELYIT